MTGEIIRRIHAMGKDFNGIFLVKTRKNRMLPAAGLIIVEAPPK